MISHNVIDAVERGLFHIHTAEHISEGIELLTGVVAGSADATGNYPHGSVLGLAQKTLLNYRRACQTSGQHKSDHKSLR
jgi:hypothetical protein